ncbi:hypothetical protein [Hymenobacter coccineus]|uniref:hypothetical protein n=1 Tax=Hymenobacter coccineus TaxID=1908235 RepID=UPI000A86D832|nr:hypothetical protein [Hymenobacter coccineus]
MRPFLSFLPLTALLLGSLSLSSCGGGENGTSTPTSTLGTESNASKVGGIADSTGVGSTMGAPANGTGNTSPNGADTGNSMNGGGTGSTGTSNTGATMGSSPAGSAGTGAGGTTNGPN